MDSKLCIGDLAIWALELTAGQFRLLGRVVAVLADGWVKVEDAAGRVDEYPMAAIRRA